MKSSILPLEGITVISIEQAIAAPLCTRHLADLGARVIKIERPEVGDFARQYDDRTKGLASHFVWVNRSKESLTLDLKTADGLAVLKKLLKNADVFLQNLAPGAVKRMGLSFDDLKEEHPKLICCNISGYGEGGPFEKRKAYDLLIQSESGFLSVTGEPGMDHMAKAGISIADISAGIYAYNNILAALLLRAKTNKGSNIDVSMLESMVEWMGFPMYYAFEGAPPPSRAGAAHASIYPYGPFPAGSGGIIMLGLQNEREWEKFCDLVLQAPHLKNDKRFNGNIHRTTNRTQLRQIIVDTFSHLDKADILLRLEQADIAYSSVNEMKDIWAHPQLKARNRWVSVDSPVGMLPALLPPGQNNAYMPVMGAIPQLGQHNDFILTELGYDAQAIKAMHEKNII